MTRTEQSLISELLDAAKSAGADGADAMLARGEGTSVDLRLGKVEASERSEDFDAGLRFCWPAQRFHFNQPARQRQYQIAGTARSGDGKNCHPTTSMHASPTALSWPNSFPSWKCMMNTFQRLMI